MYNYINTIFMIIIIIIIIIQKNTPTHNNSIPFNILREIVQ